MVSSSPRSVSESFLTVSSPFERIREFNKDFSESSLPSEDLSSNERRGKPSNSDRALSIYHELFTSLSASRLIKVFSVILSSVKALLRSLVSMKLPRSTFSYLD
jgi:hypothetical protein